MKRTLKICVPSKGRAEAFCQKTKKILDNTRLPWTVFIEPQDYTSYRKVVPSKRIHVLDEDDRGLGYSLNAIKEHCQSRGYRFVWKMDDDVSHIYTAPRIVSKEHQGEALDLFGSFVETFVDEKRVGGFSLPNKFFHTNWKPITHVNKLFEGIFIIRPEDWFCPPEMLGHNEDPIASAHLIFQDKCVIRSGLIAWDANFSTLQGGLQLSSPGKERRKQQLEAVEWLQQNHPEFASTLVFSDYDQKDNRIFRVLNKKRFNKEHSFVYSSATEEWQWLERYTEFQANFPQPLPKKN